MDDIRCVSGPTQEAVFTALEGASWTERPPPSAIRGTYTVAIVAQNEQEWMVEKARVLKMRGSAKAFSTPKGSTFTPAPLGKFTPVCLVFGDAMSAYTGCLSRQLTKLPLIARRTSTLFDGVIPDDNKELGQQDKNALSFVQSWATMQHVLEAGVKPVTSVGFSLGTLVMQWCHAPLTPAITKACADADKSSPLWKDDALCGQMNVLRRRWGIDASVPTSDFWSAWFVLDVADVDDLREGIKPDDRVRVVVIESDRRCILVGHPASCQSHAAALGITLTPFSMSLLAHCDWVPDEMAHAAGMAYWNPDIDQQPQAEYARGFASMYCGCVDFRGKVREAFEQGCRIFLEVGCDSKRTGAISEILKGVPGVLALAMDGKVGDAATQHRRVMAQVPGTVL